MPKWNGGVIGVANNPTISSAKGIWSLSEATKAIRAGLWPPSNAGADPYFENVTMLLSADGTNGAQNNTFLDSSTNAFTITRNGNTTQGTFTPFSKPDGRWSNYFDGSGDYFTTPSNAALAFGSSNFTLEFWIYATSFPSTDGRPLGNASSWAANAWSLHNDHTSHNEKFSFWVNNYSSGSAMLVSTSSSTLNTWHHVAVTRDGNTWRMFVNGALEATQTSSVAMDGGSSDDLFIGGSGNAGEYIGGYLSNVRAVKGTAVYTAAFTTPTAPLTAITNTSLLTCQSNRFIDNSTNAFAITRNGDVSVQTFSPFPALTAYSAGTNGGSGYFDGSGDYLSIGTQTAFGVGTGAVTIEAWFYPQATGAYQGIISTRATSANLGLCINNSNTFEFTLGTSSLTSTAFQFNAWNHAVGVRSTVGGTTTTSLFLNGTRVATSTSITGDDGSTRECVLGRYYADTNNYYYTGYISGARILKGTAVYDPTQSTLTLPTAPATAITNTSLLCNFTNGGIVDAAMSNDLETVGNAQISTTQSKFGGSSMYFANTGDNLKLPRTTEIGSGDFTFEMWIYPSSFANYRLLFDNRSSDPDANGFAFGLDSNAKVYVYTNNGFLLTTTTAISANTWTHIALVRSGSSSGNLKIYINGTADATTATTTANFSRTSGYIGNDLDGTGAAFVGYIDDLRITKGYARYTANFTAPVGAFVGFGD
jgi:hypothetical protein